MRQCVRGLIILVLGIAVISLSSCATCKTPYRRELTNNPNLSEAETSYRKAIHLLDKAECALAPEEAQNSFTNAESYLSDAIFKLKELGHDKNIDVTEDVYYCEKIKSETDVKIGAANREMIKP
jgi:exopolysaccharide biosynthesis protein